MVTLDFLIPATVLGMVGPVVAKMAVEAARKSGSAIGDVYFWGAVGSIAGTFLSGFRAHVPRRPPRRSCSSSPRRSRLLAAGLIGAGRQA